MNAPSLPPEIVDDIISRVDCLRQSSLALVSKDFRPQVQRLRFRHITLHDERPDRTERLSNVLVRNPTLGNYVQMVSLAFSRARKIDSAKGQASDMLERILRACHIQTLVITYGVVPQQIIQLLSARNLPHLRCLKLGKASHTPMDTLHDVLSLHPSLDQVELYTTHLHISRSPSREPIHFKRLCVTVQNTGVENDWASDNWYRVDEEFTIIISAVWPRHIVPISHALQAWASTSRRVCFRMKTISLSLREF
jgi:hypothetical protein